MKSMKDVIEALALVIANQATKDIYQDEVLNSLLTTRQDKAFINGESLGTGDVATLVDIYNFVVYGKAWQQPS